ncbi:MAG: DNA-processing protein DprA [Deltaproteobacteria bacterium]
MTRLEALVGLNKVADIGSIRLKKLLAYFGTPQDIFDAGQDRLMNVAGIGETIARKISSFKEEESREEIGSAKKCGVRIMTLDDAQYPVNLRNIPDPPIVLYVKGELKEEDRLAVGIVGSRRASFYGLSNAHKFAADLAVKGFTIISGMARGIDTYAHKGALSAGGRTIAVMGSGFNRLYPPENRELGEEIAGCGALVSEFAMDTEPFKQNFPRRNRVISGLSLGILVAEASRNSGALITADFALEQGRDVFALPGKLGSLNSWGTNGLIKEGASLVSCADEIIEEFGLEIDTGLSVRKIKSRAVGDLPEEEAVLYGSVSDSPACLDEILEKTNFTGSRAAELILKLQIKKLIKELPGKQFVRN